MNKEFKNSRLVYLSAFTGVLIFSLTGPVTKIALESIPALTVASGRGLIAGLAALVVLVVAGVRAPRRSEIKLLIPVVLGVAFGFPYFTCWAMEYVSAAEVGVVFGLIPFATACLGRLLIREKESVGFWLLAVIALTWTLGFSAFRGIGMPLFLLIAVGMAAIGYAYGGLVAKTLGGWQTICWCLVVALPVNGFVFGVSLNEMTMQPSQDSFIALLYLGLFSHLIGFFFWYRALAMGGIIKVSQLQILQPFLTLVFANILLGENLEVVTWIFGVGISLLLLFQLKPKMFFSIQSINAVKSA